MKEEVLAWLSSKGMGVLRNALVSKGQAWVEDKIGMKIPTDVTNVTLEVTTQLKQAEMEFEEDLLQVSINDKQNALDNRKLDIEEEKVEVDNTKSARDMNARIQESKYAEHIAKVAPYYLDFLVVGFTLVCAVFLFFIGVPAVNEKLAYAVLGSLVTLTGTIINFHRGSSASSKSKDDVISAMQGAQK